MKMATFFFKENKHGIMDDGEHDDSDDLGSNSSALDISNGSNSDSDSDSDSDLFEEVISSSSSSSFAASSPPSATPTRSMDPLHDMSSLLQELPIKRGLSKHYNGKSQSFTSLSNVRSLEDLAKFEQPHNKKLKTCKSYQKFDENNNNNNNNGSKRHMQTVRRRMKKTSLRGRGGSFSSLCKKSINGSFVDKRSPLIPPPLPAPPHKSDTRNTFNTQTPLFALGV